MRKEISHQPDFFLIWSLVALIFLGLLMLFTSSSWISLEKTKKSTSYLFHQILYGLLPGIVLLYLFSRLSLNFLKKLVSLFFILAIVLLAILFIPRFGFKTGGAISWLQIGPILFQPSEFAKLALVCYLAAFFERKIKEKKMKSFKESLLPFLVILSLFAILILLQPDIGTFGVLALISLFMFFGAGGTFSHTLFLILIGIGVIVGGAFIFPHEAKRILTFINPEKDVLGAGYQINQSLIALGSGGIFGKGFGNGIQKYNYLPQPMGDTIFAVWAEETGFIGSLIVVILFLLICWRGFIISKRAPDRFSQLLAIGITCWISTQAFLHIMAVCALVPFTGLPLPFVSYGGSALISALIGAGILINISRKTA